MLANNPSVLTGGGVATNLVNGTGLFANGTAAAPSISFASDPTKGFFSDTANQIGVAISGARALRIASGGTLYGGTVANYLDLPSTGAVSIVAAGTNQSITLTPSGTGFAQIGSASGTLLLIGTGTNSNNGAIQLATHTTSAGGIGFGTDWSFYRIDANYFALSTTTGGATALRLQRSGTNYGQLYFDLVDSYVEPLVNIPFSIRINGQYALTCDTSRNTTFAGIVIHKSYTVATLPAAAAGNTYGTTFVSDATQLAGVGIGTAPTGGGAVKRAVYSTGAAWLLL